MILYHRTMKKSVIFVIVTYRPNRKKLNLLVKALSTWPVIVVDNTKNNRGYGGGANVGIRKAIEEGAEWIVNVNDDMHISKHAIAKFVKKLSTLPPSMAGPYIGGLNTRRWTTILPSRKVDYLSGTFVATHRNVFLKVGLFYKPYFLYYEDTDIFMRAKKAGFPYFHVPVAGIIHEGSLTFGKNSFLHQYYHARNHLLFVERQAPMRVKLYEFLRLPKTLIEHVTRREWGALLGLFHYFIRRFGKL